MKSLGPPVSIGVYWDALKGSIAEIAAKNLALIAAGVAFFGMFSLFPALAAVISLLSLISDPDIVVAQMEDMRPLLPGDVYDIINNQVVSLVSGSRDSLGWAGLVSLGLALWSARAGVGAMMIGLNAVYNERNRNTGWHYFRALLLTVALIVVGITSALMLIVAPVVLAFVPLGTFNTIVIDVLRYTIAILVIFVGIGVLYRFGPNRKPARVPWISFGAVLAVLSWGTLSYGFSYYVANFGNYNQVYGSIGAVIAMLIWLWISSFLLLFGASMNAQIELRTVPDSTIGKARPMGKRGAFVADNYVKPGGESGATQAGVSAADSA